MPPQSEFDSTQWAERMATVLQDLAQTQSAYKDDLTQPRLPFMDDSLEPDKRPCLPPYTDHGRVHQEAYFSLDPSPNDHFHALRTALQRTLVVLALHPVFQNASASQSNDYVYWIEIMNNGTNTHLINVVEGLIERAMEPPCIGFMEASVELDSLLRLSQQTEVSPLPSQHNVGFHAHLFFGIRVPQRIEISNNVSLVQMEHIKPYISESWVVPFAPDVYRYRQEAALAALIKPFVWAPVLRSRREASAPEEPLPPPFFESTAPLVQLLAITHLSPVGPVLCFHHGIHPSATRLVGFGTYVSTLSWIPAHPSIEQLQSPPALRADALACATSAYQHRHAPHFDEYTPVISRLSESLGRSGQYQREDKILDVSIALERLYELDSSAIAQNLRMRGACLLTDSTERRKKIFNQFKRFYNVRSAIIHHRHASKATRKLLSDDNLEQTFRIGFGLARDTLIKLLAHGPPSDWDNFVISARNP